MLKSIYKRAAGGVVAFALLAAVGAQASVNPYGVISAGEGLAGAVIVSPQVEAQFDHFAKQGGVALLQRDEKADGGGFIKSSRIETVPGQSRTYRVTTVITDSSSGGFFHETEIARFSGSGQKGDPVRMSGVTESAIATPNMQKLLTAPAP